MEHTGKHAIVTGGGSGIGRGIALALAEQGAEVTITGRRLDVLDQVAATHARLHALQMDVADEASVRDGIAAAAQARGPVQICIANAGIAEGGAFAKITLADWRRTMATNLDGVFLTFQAALDTLDTDTPARMIVVSSIAGVRGLKNAIPYTASKHAVIGLMRGLSEEFLGKRPITFNALCPGYVDTDIVQSQLPGLMRKFDVDRAGAAAMVARANRSRTLLEVDETTAAMLWLCSDAARSVNGQTIEISGGQV
ncbi:SDR family oxidoreductase [Loktanella sp. SALINAS62]|uniref:SDR family NAD(P)-dependent oxidoreductase n=1 Tax=Loktanella sp. SALINAS62 TaxID=2706124 RepID=UPI001B8D42F7|nr:SDR family oxidoreductase [Loktanella sp. SALINAS62]MBS1304249.1 SDR family oxidoreductase [Loktanella sp. SALINAS62]